MNTAPQATEKSASAPRPLPRHRLRLLHLYLGLPAAAFLLVVGLTGTLLAFREPLDRLLNYRLTHVAPQSARLRLSDIVQKLQQAYPGCHVAQLNLPDAPDAQLDAILLPERPGPFLPLAVNPYTGQVLGNWDNSNHFMDRVRDLHKTLLIRNGGEGIVKLLALALLGLGLTGVILWLRRKRLNFSSGPGMLELHCAVGICAAPFLALFAWTAVQPMPPSWSNRVWPTFVEPAHPVGATVLPPEALLAAAQHAVPGASPVWLDVIWQPAHGGTVVGLRYPGDHSLMGRVRIHIDPYSGKILHVVDPRLMSLPFKWATVWKHEVHEGVILGWPSRLVACLSGLALALLALTGPVVWWKRKRRSDLSTGA